MSINTRSYSEKNMRKVLKVFQENILEPEDDFFIVLSEVLPLKRSAQLQSNFFKQFLKEVVSICYREDRVDIFRECVERYSSLIKKPIAQYNFNRKLKAELLESQILTLFLKEEASLQTYDNGVLWVDESRQERFEEMLEIINQLKLTSFVNKTKKSVGFKSRPIVLDVSLFFEEKKSDFLIFWLNFQNFNQNVELLNRIEPVFKKTIYQDAFFKIDSLETLESFNLFFPLSDLEPLKMNSFSFLEAFPKMLLRVVNEKESGLQDLGYFLRTQIQQDPLWMERFKSMVFSDSGLDTPPHTSICSCSVFLEVLDNHGEGGGVLMESILSLISKEEKRLGNHPEDIKFLSIRDDIESSFLRSGLHSLVSDQLRKFQSEEMLLNSLSSSSSTIKPRF